MRRFGPALRRRPAPVTGRGLRDRHDAGLTLTELLISITILGIISAALGSAVIVFLRNEAATTNRLNESRDLQQLTVWLPGDVASTAATDIDLGSGTPSLCSGYSGGGSNALSLVWTETFNATSLKFAVSYRVETVGSMKRLVRVSCAGAPQLGPAQVIPIAKQLGSVATSLVNGSAVTLTLTEATGRKLTLSATSNNPNRRLS